jgi:hypothetical protein
MKIPGGVRPPPFPLCDPHGVHMTGTRRMARVVDLPAAVPVPVASSHRYRAPRGAAAG